ncbi:MAG: peptidoglycan DD-metalloendopeptidase family protein [Tannerella sp.]|jgi:murein DD-endopeptidase MepM/ murein hydrolase activator NlpD|nr:peptidoglycan DD-metalloendopeptidase family protein [Tannerella sp.]
MNIRNILSICCGFIVGIHVSAEAQRKIVVQDASTNERLDRQVSELMANRVSPTQIISNELAVAKLDEYNELLAAENLMFPADELYNSNWDTVHVNPFLNAEIEFPDAYNIDCSSFTMPVDQEQIRVTSKYGPRRRRMHRGIDLGLHVGDTVRAAFDGKVRIKSYERRGYGYYLVLRHPNGLETVYGHLSKFLVRENQHIHAGEPIALGGNTGRSTGPHLHFETRFLGKDINPSEIIDFENKTPHKDEYVFHNIKINGKKSNIYSTSADAIAVHRVKQGETLGLIARRYGTSVAELCRLNGISQTSTLSIGQSIRFRAKQVTVEASADAVQKALPAKPENTQTPAANAGTSTGKKIEVPVQTSSDEDVPDGVVYHKIQSGDTLSSLSQKYGISIRKLCEINNITQNMILKIGQKIRCS